MAGQDVGNNNHMWLDDNGWMASVVRNLFQNACRSKSCSGHEERKRERSLDFGKAT